MANTYSGYMQASIGLEKEPQSLVRDRRPETGDCLRSLGDRRPETRDCLRSFGDRRPQTGDFPRSLGDFNIIEWKNFLNFVKF